MKDDDSYPAIWRDKKAQAPQPMRTPLKKPQVQAFQASQVQKELMKRSVSDVEVASLGKSRLYSSMIRLTNHNPSRLPNSVENMGRLRLGSIML